jgi:hypothetical protein
METARSFETSEDSTFFEVLIFKFPRTHNAAYFKVFISTYFISQKKPSTIFL